jgi:hypothetical protein
VVNVAARAARRGVLRLDFAEVQALCVEEAARRPAVLQRFARSIGVSIAALLIAGVGWYPPSRAVSVPMRDGADRVVGIRLRAGGRKFAVLTSRDGLFLPCPIVPGADGGPVFVVEGDSDTLAALELGLVVVGRPNARAGTELLLEVLRGVERHVIVFADRDDEHATGQVTANELAATLRAELGCVVRVAIPPAPFKDIRAWINATGADADAVLALAAQAPERQAITTVTLIEGRA